MSGFQSLKSFYPILPSHKHLTLPEQQTMENLKYSQQSFQGVKHVRNFMSQITLSPPFPSASKLKLVSYYHTIKFILSIPLLHPAGPYLLLPPWLFQCQNFYFFIAINEVTELKMQKPGNVHKLLHVTSKESYHRVLCRCRHVQIYYRKQHSIQYVTKATHGVKK